MRIASNHLEAFYAVAKYLSFSKGAQSIYVTQSAISQRMAALESDLGTSLFIRDRAGLKLTASGLNLLRYCQQQEQSEMELLSTLRSKNHNSTELTGEIRIGGFSSIARSVILPALSPVLQKHPNLGLNLVTKELSQLMSLLKSSEVDLIITHEKPTREDTEAIYLGIEENILVESKKHKNLDVYLDHDHEDVTTNLYFKLLKKSAQKIKKRYVDDVYGLIDGVKNGLGRAVLPRHLIDQEKDFTILNPNAILKVPLYLVFYKQPYYSQLHQLAVSEIEKYFKSEFR
jgi:DNA-binding transcriptional LysR family regulator